MESTYVAACDAELAVELMRQETHPENPPMRAALLTILLVATPVFAQAPNTLSPAEARTGWILLFDGESTLGWEATGDVAVRDGRLAIGRTGTEGGKIVWRGNLPPAFEMTTEIQGSALYFRGRDKEEGAYHILDEKRAGNSWKQFSYVPQVKGMHEFGFAAAKDRAEIRSIKLLPKGTTNLFNGKDLSGWKIFDGKKSTFAVKEGFLTIENGPGDLQTEKSYKNFLLQLECRTNGKHLNSGVFFRCRAGEYQNGYEAQINNNFTAAPPKDYIVEEYDPKTNKLLEKRKVKSTAADFGTGSIYRRIPATKDIAKDGEWFTLTVLAHGNHFATWVDGMQTVDWYDNRPPNDNARNGYRAAAGHISLQGHDPTTNLSFRNIRIAELPD